MIEIAKQGAEQFIRQLAERHGVKYVRTHGDELAETFTRLSGDDVTPDEIELLAIALKRSGVITGREMGELIAMYLNEKKAAETARKDVLRGSVVRYSGVTEPVDAEWGGDPPRTPGDILRTMTPQPDFMKDGRQNDES